MHFLHTIAAMEDEPVAFGLLREAAAWLKEKNIDYWRNWLNPPPRHRDWIHDGFLRKEFYFVHDRKMGLIGMYRLQDQDELFWGRRDDKAGYIHSFTTRREHHNQGIGRRILEDIETALKAEKKEYLRLDCGRDNPGLRAYYERYGFQNAGEIRVEGETLNLYEKALS